jgi:signal peptidase I
MRWIRRVVALGFVVGVSACTDGATVPDSHERVYVIQGQNMEHTLHGCPGCTDDRVAFDLLALSDRSVRDGDIVVFHAPPSWFDGSSSTLVSRVIATGGQTVKGDAAGHVLISTTGVDGPYRRLREPYVFIDPGSRSPGFGPVTVPRGRVWLLGDHRNDSSDSRYHCSLNGLGTTLGDRHCDPVTSTIPVAGVIGVAVRIVAPPSRVRSLG